MIGLYYVSVERESNQFKFKVTHIHFMQVDFFKLEFDQYIYFRIHFYGEVVGPLMLLQRGP